MLPILYMAAYCVMRDELVAYEDRRFVPWMTEDDRSFCKTTRSIYIPTVQNGRVYLPVRLCRGFTS